MRLLNSIKHDRIIVHMDTTKWKSLIVPRPVYEQIRSIAEMEDRPISRQIRIIFEQWKEDRVREARQLETGEA